MANAAQFHSCDDGGRMTDVQAPSVKGWCPGAHRPMMSGDGLVVRIRPRRAALSATQVMGLCDLAERYGSGVLDLTSRANVQMRAVAQKDHADVLRGLMALDLLDADADIETRRNIILTPLHAEHGRSARLYDLLAAALLDLPKVPAKFGFVIDDGPKRFLSQAPGDIRIEAGLNGGLIVRLDGCDAGFQTDETRLIKHISAAMAWFMAQRDPRRMAAVVAAAQTVPFDAIIPPAPNASGLPMGDMIATELGRAVQYGAPFGQMLAADLRALLQASDVGYIRITPWRSILIPDASPLDAQGFITQTMDPILRVDACPGAPFCPSASVETRTLARAMAPHAPQGGLHISGCAKGCARARAAQMTFVGQNGAFDLVENGAAWDKPIKTGLSPQALLDMEWDRPHDVT